MGKKLSSEQYGKRLAGEEIAFRQQRPRLMKRLVGQYVAFYRGRLIGHDKDDEVLVLRLFSKLGGVAFYIAPVEETPRVWEVPSPELAS